jgi:hypothetical protein
MGRSALIAAVVAAAGMTFPYNATAAPDSAGTDFWVGFPDSSNSVSPSYLLLISAPAAASGTASVPGTAFSEGFSVSPGTVTPVTLPAGVEHETSDAVQTGHAVHITADAEVTVHPVYFDPGLSDGYLALPTDALGTSYHVLAYPGNASCGNAQFEVVGTQSATTVTITPTAAIGGHGAGVAYEKTLNQGSTYLAKATGSATLSGTTITADHPIVVLGGNACAQVSPGTAAANYLVEEMPPVSLWGGDFSVEPFAGRTSGDELTLVGSQAATSLTVTDAGGPVGGAPTSINAGQAATFHIDESTRIKATAPILVGHFAMGSEADATEPKGDPTMVLVPPLERYGRAQTFSTPSSGFAGRYVNVTIPSSDLGTLKLDGAPVSGGEFSPVGGDSAMSGARLPVSAGSHTLEGDGPFGVEVYGFEPEGLDAFGWPAAWGDGTRSPVPSGGAATISSVPPPAAKCKVPKLRGKKLRAVKKALTKKNCKLGRVKKKKGATAKSGKVVKQQPAPGKLLPAGSKVKVTLGA